MKGRSIEQIQAELRQEYESAYKEKIKMMYGMLELKYQSLNDSILLVFDRIKKDELLSTMLNDRTTSIHMEDRVKEIFGEVVAEQRELIFKKLGTQITHLKFQNEEISRELRRLKENKNHMEKQFMTEKLTIQQAKNNVNEQLRRTKQQNQSVLYDKQSKQQEVDNLRHKADELSCENCELRTLCANLKVNIDRYKTENGDMQKDIEKLTDNLKNNQEHFNRKYKNKKKEIEQFKILITQLKNRSDVSEKPMEFGGGTQRMAKIVRQHEQKIAEVKHINQQEKGNIERKYEEKLRETQSYFEKMLQSKMTEMESNTANFFERVKEDGFELQKKIRVYEEHYISYAQFQEQVGKRDELISVMRKKLEQFQEHSEMKMKSQDNLNCRLKESESMLSQFKQKSTQLQNINKQLTHKLKTHEQSHAIYDINQKKVKGQFQDYTRIVKKLKEDNDDLKGKCFTLEDQKSQFENNLRDKERKIKEVHVENEELNKKMKKNLQNIDQLTKERNLLVQNVNDLKKQVSNFEYMVKDQEMGSKLASGSWEIRLNNLQQQVKDKSTMLSELQEKYQQMSGLYQDQKRKNYQVQNLLKKFEMESKFYKESGQMHKSQHQSALEQIKRVLTEKNQRVQQLEQQMNQQSQKLKTKEKQSEILRQRQTSEIKKLRGKLRLMSKLIVEKLDNLRKQGRTIKEYLSSRKAILENDKAISLSTFSKEVVHYQGLIENDKDILIKRVREEMSYSQTNEVKLVKNEQQQRSRTLIERTEYEKSLLKQELKEKDERIEDLGRQIKKGQLEVRKQRDETRNIEREVQLANNKYQQLKQHYENKLREVTKEMKEDRDLIIRQHSDKRSQLEQQISNLFNTIKQLKTEIQLIISKHEDEKLIINAQLRTVKEQQEAIQKVAHQKDLQMQKYQHCYEKAQEERRVLENQVRGYAETLNKKIQFIHQLQLKENQINGELSVIKTRFDRIIEENSELKRKIGQRQEEVEEGMKAKTRVQAQLRDIKGALNRSTKNHELRALNTLSAQTLQLSQKVNEMKRFNSILDSKTPLRS